MPFDSAKWNMANRRERGRMIPDLYNKQILMHKTKKEIFELLGPAEDSSAFFLSYTFDNGKKYLGSTWVYYMNIHIDSTTKTCERISLDD